MSDECPQCSAPGNVVTAVTVPTLGNDPRRVLVTRQCSARNCHHKYPVMKTEHELDDEERRLWRNP